MNWISVKDRLPIGNVWILVSKQFHKEIPMQTLNTVISIARWIPEKEIFQFPFCLEAIDKDLNYNIGVFMRTAFADFNPDEVTHWIPLPEGPEDSARDIK